MNLNRLHLNSATMMHPTKTIWKTGTPQRLSERRTRLPQQDVIEDASTSGVAETSGVRCSAGLWRDTKQKSPQRQRQKNAGCRDSTQEVTPQRLWYSELRSVLRRHNLTWNGCIISKNDLDRAGARSESVSVANPLDGHRNCLT